MALGLTAPVIIHAGLPKTGTTYLQQRLVDNREWLASKGVRYPTLGQEVGPGHHNLAKWFRGESVGAPWSRQSPREVMTASTLGVKSGEQLLLSSETFFESPHAACGRTKGCDWVRRCLRALFAAPQFDDSVAVARRR